MSLGRQGEAANGRFVASNLQKPSLVEWQLWKKLTDRIGSGALSDDWPLSGIGISLTAFRR
jgi:hypothetical protein